MGYALAGAGDGDSPLQMGLDAKHALSPTVTGALTLNPDFRNVEQSVTSVDFTYTEQYRPDSRPFFQDGSGYFPGSDLFYTSEIGELDVGAKVYGRIGNYSIGALSARNLGVADYSIVAFGREWPEKGSIRLRGIEANTPDAHNTVGDISATYRVYDKREQKINLDAGLTTSRLGTDVSKRFEASLGQSSRPRTLGWSIGHEVIDPDYDPILSYVPENGLARWHIWTGVGDQFSDGKVNHWTTDFSADMAEYTSRRPYYAGATLSGHVHWQNGDAIYVDLAASGRHPDDAPDSRVYDDKVIRLRYRWASNDLYRQGNARFSFGRQAGGSYLYWQFDRGWLLTDRLSMNASYEYSRISEPSPDAYSSGQLIATMAYDLDNDRTIAGRVVSTAGKANLYLAFRQRVRSGTDVYVIFGDPNAETTRNSILLKLIRPL